MIGSVLFYILYPFSRFLTGRNSEAPRKGHPPAVVVGKAVWDGGTVTTRELTQSHTTLLDQCLSSGSGMEAETKERMKEQIPEMKCITNSNKDKNLFAVQENVKNGDAPNKSDVHPVERDEEGESGYWQLQDKVEALENGCRKITHQDERCHVKKNTEEGSVIVKDGITLKQELCAQFDCLNMEENTFPVQEKLEQPSSEACVVLAEPSIRETSCQVQEQTKTPIMKESKTPAGVAECWDEYSLPAEDEVLTNAQTHLEINKQHDSQTGWHFPAGPGLAEEAWCPLWQFPAVSYYPPLEPTGLFEVMWRVWEEVAESTTAAEPTPKFSPFTSPTMDFTVMSYNILAQDLLEANQELYTHCPLEVLDWSYRCSLLLEEIAKWAPDILCLQEVQENHYNEHLFPVLSQMGYTCVYKRRTGDKTDGCATCYRSNLFSERSVTLLEFYRPDTELLDRHNVGIVLLLQPVVTRDSVVKAKGPPLCVANTHLLFNPRRGDVKLAQLAILMADIDSVVRSCKAMGEHCNIILCGDFNSLPHTPLYQLITTGELYFQGLPAWMISGQEDLSYKVHCHRLLAPLWPSSLGITDSCQYSTVKEIFKDQNQKPVPLSLHLLLYFDLV
ncbi:protein angel homolog 1 isoform X2 [Cheilinus undulatus]|uniref:protein angel homolog 1 isoform X2 n=1 Tax=Cheilinus undulatus TaxID=241271 RepID=UPI001BD636BD|nr:protein angel homolog 1 isoform X2 [Cheilinus undulatus]